jgi:hypothetical protein
MRDQFNHSRFVTHLLGTITLLISCVLQGCGTECQNIWHSEETTSPDGKWIADIRQYICNAGLGSAQEENVELRLANNHRSRVTVLSPSGQWGKPEEVTLRWLSASVLEVTVPNRTSFGTQVSLYRGVTIRVRYKNDDPADRANWLSWVKRNSEWANSASHEPQPKPPPLPSSTP